MKVPSFGKFVESLRSTPTGQTWDPSTISRGAQANARTALNRIKPGQKPAWADLDEIEAIYICAAIKGFQMRSPFDVDHIEPLKGEDRSGLHVQSNLQILPRKENVRKGNRVFGTGAGG